jgi:hypothetical protein
MYNTSTEVYYWTSAISPSNTYAYFLYYNSSLQYESYGSKSSTLHGTQVRCVKN